MDIDVDLDSYMYLVVMIIKNSIKFYISNITILGKRKELQKFQESQKKVTHNRDILSKVGTHSIVQKRTDLILYSFRYSP